MAERSRPGGYGDSSSPSNRPQRSWPGQVGVTRSMNHPRTQRARGGNACITRGTRRSCGLVWGWPCDGRVMAVTLRRQRPKHEAWSVSHICVTWSISGFHASVLCCVAAPKCTASSFACRSIDHCSILARRCPLSPSAARLSPLSAVRSVLVRFQAVRKRVTMPV